MKGRASANDNKDYLFISNRSSKKMRHNDRIVKGSPMDRLVKIELDAAQALADFSRMAHLPVQNGSWETAASGLQWSGKRKRSSRIYQDAMSDRLDGNSGVSWVEEKTSISSIATAHLNKASDSNADSYLYEESFKVKTKNSHPLSMSNMNKQENSPLLESSKDSISFESRAESPISPLQPLDLDCKAVIVGGASASSAFRRVVPVRPIQKLSALPFRPKAEGVNSELEPSISGQSAKLADRGKPWFYKTMASTISHVETVDCSEPTCFTLQRPGIPIHEFLENRSMGKTETAGKAEEQPLPLLPKADGREIDQHSVSKSKLALKEIEKEASRLRRIQANRESARQTIRRKQVLCEELTQKAARLTVENEEMKQKKKKLMQKFEALNDENRHLKEQLVTPSGILSGHASMSHSMWVPPVPVSVPTLQAPMFPYPGVTLQSLAWYFALSQAAAANQALAATNWGMLMGMDFNSVTCGNGMSSGLWMGRGSSSEEHSPTGSFPHPYFLGRGAQFSPCFAAKLCSPSLMPEEASSKPISCDMDKYPLLNSGEESCKGQEEVESHTADVDGKETQLSCADSSLSSACQDHLFMPGSSSQHSLTTAKKSIISQDSEAQNQEKVSGLSEVNVSSGHLDHCFGNVTPQLASPHGISINGSGRLSEGSQQSCSFHRREVLAAAEARRRRKELTRSKILHSHLSKLHRR